MSLHPPASIKNDERGMWVVEPPHILISTSNCLKHSHYSWHVTELPQKVALLPRHFPKSLFRLDAQLLPWLAAWSHGVRKGVWGGDGWNCENCSCSDWKRICGLIGSVGCQVGTGSVLLLCLPALLPLLLVEPLTFPRSIHIKNENGGVGKIC